MISRIFKNSLFGIMLKVDAVINSAVFVYDTVTCATFADGYNIADFCGQKQL